MSFGDPDLQRKIASRLKLAREMVGLSQGQVARHLKVSRPLISELEAGRRALKASEVAEFSSIYRVDSKWLLCQNEDDHGFSDQVQIAARQLGNLAPDDLQKLVTLVQSLENFPDSE